MPQDHRRYHERIVPRWEELQQDIAQEAELARLEARRVGHRLASERSAARIREEKRWFQATNVRWEAPSEVRDDDD